MIEMLDGGDYLEREVENPTVMDPGEMAIDFSAGDFEQYEKVYFSDDYFSSMDVEPEGILATPNTDLKGDVHDISGVPYETNTILTDDGRWKEGVFPVFDAQFEGKLPVDEFHSGSYTHAQLANEQLQWAFEQNPDQFDGWSEMQIEQLMDGETPEGFTWHHHEEMGRIQLVASDMHGPSAHAGGMSIWGGGY